MSEEKKAAKTVKSNQDGEDLSEQLEKLIKTLSKDKVSHNEVYTKALDDLVNVNSLFTVAVFIGLSFASRNQQTLEDKPECRADPLLGKRLIVYEVVSFGAFLLSSLMAKSMKVHLNIFGNTRFDNSRRLRVGRGFMFLSSVLASVVGVVFLTLSMTNVVQLTIGKVSCGSGHAIAAVASLCTLVALALVVYLPSMVFAIIYSVLPSHVESKKKQSIV